MGWSSESCPQFEVCPGRVGYLPGLPLPHGDGQEGSPALLAFHSAKSRGFFLSEVVKLDSDSLARAEDPAAQGLSFGYTCPLFLYAKPTVSKEESWSG